MWWGGFDALARNSSRLMMGWHSRTTVRATLEQQPNPSEMYASVYVLLTVASRKKGAIEAHNGRVNGGNDINGTTIPWW